MIKNIILFFLAIYFVLLIISYILNINEIKLWNSSFIEGVCNDEGTTLSIDQIASARKEVSAVSE